MDHEMPKERKDMRVAVRGLYDLQKLRISSGLRLVANWKAESLGVKPGEREEELDADGKRILKQLRADYKRLTDGVASGRAPRKFEGAELISNIAEFQLMAAYLGLEEAEARQLKAIHVMLPEHRIWSEWLDGVAGCGPAMAGVIISEIDITRARYASSLYKYAGLDVVEVKEKDGTITRRGRSMRRSDMETVSYTDKDGNEAERKSLGYNPFLKTKLRGVLAGSFLKQGVDRSEYARAYYDHKHRLESAPETAELTKNHRHNRAMRYMTKLFLLHLYQQWRPLEGLDVFKPYPEAKLGMQPHRGVSAEG